MVDQNNKTSITFSGVFQMRNFRYLLLMLATFAFPALAEVNMTNVEFNSLPGGQVEMKFSFDESAPTPKIYTIESPARIALDLENVSSKLKQKKHTLDLGNAQSVVVVGSGNRTRVIVNLLELTKYETRIDGNDLFVVVGNDGVKDYLKEAPAQLEQKIVKEVVSAISSVDFRRGEDGAGRLLIELTNPNIDVDSRVEGKSIILSFIETSLPENLRLKYDVSDFATPVNWFKADETDGVATIEVEPTGEYEYLAYQAENSYVLTIKPLSEEDIEAKKKQFEFVGDKLSLNFQNIDVRAVLQLIADFTDLNLVASDTVNGKITLRLLNVPWDQALDLILKTKGLDKRQEGNVLLVAPAAEIAQREQQEIATNKQLEELAPLQTEFIRIRYATATDIFALLKGGGSGGEDGGSESTGSLLSSRATVVVDDRTNSLLVTETAQKLEDIRKLINLIDVPIRQVLIEARIVIANSDAADALGVQWGGYNVRNSKNGGNISSQTVVSDSSQSFTDVMAGSGTVGYGNVVDFGVGSGDGTTNLNIGFLTDSKRRVLDFTLSAIESSGNGEVVSQPKIITGDKQQATIESGSEIAYQESSASGGTTTAFKSATLKLDVTPSITPDDRVIMELDISQDSLGPAAVDGSPTIDTTSIKTEVLVNNGETVVLGGIFQTTELESEVKTPFLGDIPYLGRLFKRKIYSMDKTEILIFITPRILADSLVE